MNIQSTNSEDLDDSTQIKSILMINTDHFDPYNVLLDIATNVPTYDRFCGPGSHLCA